MINPRKTVGEIATEIPKSMRVFERHGIDYSCGGQRTLTGICSERDIPLNRLVDEIESASPPSVRRQADFDDLTALIDHIVSAHHTFTRAELGRLVPLAESVRRTHAAQHGDLDAVHTMLVRLAAHLGVHMDNEESVLFPECVALEEAASQRRGPPRTGASSVARTIAAVRREHEAVTKLLRELHVLTFGYRVPDDADDDFRALYQGLAALEHDLYEHIHLENNVAFPAAERMDRELRGSHGS
jgi:regulator of cell morphogenesis and NO signaling